MNQTDLRLLERAIEVARSAREKTNHPFGALLADADGNILLEAENTVVTERDCTGHAELNLMRLASKQYDREFLAECSVYASAEPCAMCAGSIFWGNVRRVVYALGIEPLYAIIQDHDENPSFYLHAREVLSKASWPIEVLGPEPSLQEEAQTVHVGYWT